MDVRETTQPEIAIHNLSAFFPYLLPPTTQLMHSETLYEICMNEDLMKIQAVTNNSKYLYLSALNSFL